MKKMKLGKVLVMSMVGGFVGKFIYDEYIKDTPMVDVTKKKIHAIKVKGDEVAALFVKENQKEESKIEESDKIKTLRAAEEAAMDIDNDSDR